MVKRLAISDRTCRREWFQRFKSGGDFTVEDRHSGGRDKVVEDSELVAILSEDSCHIEDNLSESLGISRQVSSQSVGMIEKEGCWIPHELKPRRDGEQRLFAYEQLLERQMRKGFLHRIVTGYITITPNARRKSWGLLGGHTA
nr:Mariner Mos1 transposase [Hymenolepis microstoma]